MFFTIVWDRFSFVIHHAYVGDDGNVELDRVLFNTLGSVRRFAHRSSARRFIKRSFPSAEIV